MEAQDNIEELPAEEVALQAAQPAPQKPPTPQQPAYLLFTLADIFAKLGGGPGLGVKLPRVYDHGSVVEFYRDINGHRVTIATAQVHHIAEQIDAHKEITIRAMFTKLNTDSQFVPIDPKWFESASN